MFGRDAPAGKILKTCSGRKFSGGRRPQIRMVGKIFERPKAADYDGRNIFERTKAAESDAKKIFELPRAANFNTRKIFERPKATDYDGRKIFQNSSIELKFPFNNAAIRYVILIVL